MKHTDSGPATSRVGQSPSYGKCRVSVYHNILWSKYKGVVFGALSSIEGEILYEFTQIAETEAAQALLSPVDLSYHRYPYRLLFKGGYSSVPAYRRSARLFLDLLRRPADLVILPCYDKPEYWAMMAACKLKRVPRAVFCDSTINDRRQTWIKSALKRLFFSSCDGYFAYGTRSREYLVSLGARPELVFQRCQAAALPFEYSESNVMRIRAFRKSDHTRLLFVGRLSPEKNLVTLLASFARIRETDHDAKLRLVGDGPQKSELRALAAKMGVDQWVDFVGSLSSEDLAKEYLDATCLVLPSLSEPWGLVVNEALHYGCPVVVSDKCGCVPELVVEGVTGYTFLARDQADLYRALLNAISLARESSTSAGCIKHISTYSPARAAQQIDSGCKVILKNKG